MSAAVATVSVTQVWDDGKMLHVIGSIAISASPATYTNNGIAMALSDPLIKAQRTPQKVEVKGIGGYIYSYVKGSDNTNGLLRVFAQTASASEDDPLGQLAASAIPAGVSGDTIDFEAVFLGQN